MAGTFGKVSKTVEKKQLINRLRRAQGQLKGLERLICEEADCEQILTQLSACRAALEQLSIVLISEKIKDCLQTSSEQQVEVLLKKFLKGTVK